MKNTKDTKWDKLVSWHVDVYNGHSDERCLVCLSGKEKYALSQALRQMKWATRWLNPEDETVPDFVQVAETLELKLNPEECYDICPEVADCIEFDENVQAQINALIQQFADENGGNPFYNNPSPAGVIEDFSDNLSCDPDKLFGQARRFVKFMHTNNVDFLELMELASNPIERADLVISAIPALETLPVDEIFELADSTQQLLFETYNASWTQGVEDDLTCDFFCFLKQRCEGATGVTAESIYQFWFDEFEENVANLGVFSTLNIILQTLITGTYAGVEIVYLLFVLQVAYFKFLSQYIGVYTRRFSTQLALGAEVSSNDHTTLCDSCNELEWALLVGTNFGNPLPTRWTADSVPVSGGNHAVTWEIVSGSPCGRISSVTHSAGFNQVGFISKRRCGEGATNSQNVAQLTGECLEYFRMISTDPFTMQFDISEEC